MKIANKNCTQFVNKVNKVCKHNKLKPVGLGASPIPIYPTGFTITILNYL